MKDSLFISAAFILTETSFFVVAAIAAYELLLGDFVWAQQQEEARRALKQTRGRGDGSFDSRRLQQQLHGQPRSLSPGGRGAATRGVAYSYAPSSRRAAAPSEETSLLHPQPSSRGGSRERRMVVEEVHYASPGDTRFASPGRGSIGDSTRRTFYKVILLALLSRFLLLPVETYCLYQMTTSSTTLNHLSPSIHILLRISQTLPDVAFASAFAFLIIFCAKIAFSAMPPLTPEPREDQLHVGVDTEIIEDGMMQREETLPVEGSVKVQVHDVENNGVSNRTSSELQRVRFWIISVVRLSRTILASEKTFVTWNMLLSISYALIFVTSLAIPNATISSCEISLWIFLAIIYSFLLLALAYAATLLGRSLLSGIESRKSANSLVGKLMGTCILLSMMLMSRAIAFGMVSYHAIFDLDNTQYEENIRSRYRKIVIEYVMSESLPILLILFMMHRKRKEVTNDVFIHSLLNNLFGSSGKLFASDTTQIDTFAPTVAPSSSAENFSTAAIVGGGLGSRRFQSYSGTRGDSFPPSGFKSRLDIPRVFSSDSKV